MNVMVIADNNTQSLKDYLEATGSLKIEYAFPSLSIGMGDLENRFVRVSKMVYLYSSNNDFRSEIRQLRVLLLSGHFFQVSEIYFFIVKSDISAEAIKFLRMVIGDVSASTDTSVRVPDLVIREYDSAPSFAELHGVIVGESREKKIDNVYYDVFLSRKDEEADMAYSPTTDTVKLEPLNYSNALAYHRVQDAVERSTSSEIIKDSKEEKRVLSHDLGQVEVKIRSRMALIFSMEDSPLFSLGMFSSSCAKGKSLFIDSSEMGGVLKDISNLSIETRKLDLREVLRADFLGLNLEHYILELNLSEWMSPRLDKRLSEIMTSGYSVVVYGGRWPNDKLLKTLSPLDPEVFHSTDASSRSLGQLGTDVNMSLVLYSSRSSSVSELSPKEIREEFPLIKKIIEFPQFKSLKLSSYMWDLLVGG